MRIFIGSSSEAANKKNPDKNFLLKIAGILRDAGAEPIPWNKQPTIFNVGETTIENLEELVKREHIEASVFIYSADDKTWSRGETKNVPRDNVVFEHGLFTGILGRTKAITIKVGDVKIPSDLYGVHSIDYDENPEHAELNISQWVKKLLDTNGAKKADCDTTMTERNDSQTNSKPFLVELVNINQGTYNRIIDNKKITIKLPFSISKYLITQSIYETVMGKLPKKFNLKGNSFPIEQVSFYDAIEFCNKMSTNEGFDVVYTMVNNKIKWNQDAKGYRLPTEAEWEYALNYSKNFVAENLNSIAWYSKNSGNKTHATGEKEANDRGIYDLLGNVWEWCFDIYADDPDSELIQQDGGSLRVLRGGSFADYETWFTIKGFRKKLNETIKNNFTGFRIVLQN